MDYLTIEEVSRKMKVTPRTISKWINRSYHPLPTIVISPKIKSIRLIDLDKWMEEEAQEIQEMPQMEAYNEKV